MSDEQTKALQTVSPATLALPDFVKADDRRGTENIDVKDLQLPRLATAQAQSPEVLVGTPKYIDGLTFGDVFVNLTRRSYGRKPVRVVVVRAEPARFIEFYPRDPQNPNAPKGVKDFNVAADDPRTKFGTDGKKPAATKFLEFAALAFLDEKWQPVAISFKGAGLKTARDLNSYIAMRQGPTFCSVFELTPFVDPSPKGAYSGFQVALIGNVDEPTFKLAEALYKTYEGKVLVTERDEHEDAPARTTTTTVDDDADVPF